MNNISSSLRFAPDILRRLGEELIPNPEQGLIELVKNSYDADADECTVQLIDVTKDGGSIIVEDRGVGMAAQDILDGFLVLGSSMKNSKKRSPIYQRLPVGDKGLGRLAALRLGTKVLVTSRPKSQAGKEFVFTIDWALIDSAKVVEDISIDILERETDESNGVRIEIQNIKNPLSNHDVSRLVQELILLADPFQDSVGFKVSLISQEFEDLEKIVKEAYFDDADLLLTAKINSLGIGKVELRRNEEVLAETDIPLTGKKPYEVPALEFDLWIYIFGSNFSSKKSSVTQVKRWLRYTGGVHFYHRNLRVRPYGEEGSDWLDMNLSRASHPEFRPSTNTVIGRIRTEDPSSSLKQPTNRIGFVEDHVFNEIKRLAKDVLRWSSDFRLKEAEKERDRKKAESRKVSDVAKEIVRTTIRTSVPKESQRALEKAFNNFTKAKEQEVVSLREELQLYRSLATAGTTSAVFAHEAAKPITMLNIIAETIERRSKKQLGDNIYNSILLEPVAKLKNISSSLNVYSQFPIYHLRKVKRILGPLKVNCIWKDVGDLFEPLLSQAKIGLFLKAEEDIEIIGSIALVEAIATNLITNSIHALTNTSAIMEGRSIFINIFKKDNNVIINHSDNGPGIKINIDDIWLPGVTTNQQGTGFGLTIVRDSVNDLKGSIEAVANGIAEGAEFILSFPIYKKQE